MKFRAFFIPCLATALAVAAFGANAREDARLWELKVTTSTGDAEPTISNSWQCMADADWASPPSALTGAQCPAQTFTHDGDTLRWSASCDAAQGAGEWTFSRRNRAVEGQSEITSGGVTTVTRLDGETSDKCTL